MQVLVFFQRKFFENCRIWVKLCITLNFLICVSVPFKNCRDIREQGFDYFWKSFWHDSLSAYSLYFRLKLVGKPLASRDISFIVRSGQSVTSVNHTTLKLVQEIKGKTINPLKYVYISISQKLLIGWGVYAFSLVTPSNSGFIYFHLLRHLINHLFNFQISGENQTNEIPKYPLIQLILKLPIEKQKLVANQPIKIQFKSPKFLIQ